MRKSNLCFIAAILLFFTSTLSVLAQGEANIWYFGEQLGLDFNTSPPTVITGYTNVPGNPGDLMESSSSISDSAGNFLFGTSGSNIYAANKTKVGVLPFTNNDKISQGVMIVPRPGSKTQYYLISIPQGPSNCISASPAYTIISVTGNTGNNIVIGSSINLSTPNILECQAIIPKYNSEDSWAIFHERNSNRFFVYSITANGILLSATYSQGPSLSVDCSVLGLDATAILKVNSFLTKLALSCNGNVYLFDFNATSGIITYNSSQALEAVYGLEFSPNSQYIYASTVTITTKTSSPEIYSFPVTDQLGSPVKLGNLDGKIRGGHLQLAPDGIIYCASMNSWTGVVGSSDYLAAIINPNSPSPTFNPQYIKFTNSNYSNNPPQLGMGLPHFTPSQYMNQVSISLDGVPLNKLANICIGETKQIQILVDNSPATSFSFSITDPNSITNTYTSSSTITYQFKSLGSYTLKYSVITANGIQVDKTSTITVASFQNASATIDLSNCLKPILTGTGSLSGNYKWYDKDPVSNGSLLDINTTYQGIPNSSVWIEPVGNIINTTITDTRKGYDYSSSTGNTTIQNNIDIARIESFNITYNGAAISGNFSVELRNSSNKLIGTPLTKTVSNQSEWGNYTLTFTPTDWNLVKGTYTVIVTSIATNATIGIITPTTYTNGEFSFTGGRTQSFVIIKKTATAVACKVGKSLYIPDCDETTNNCVNPTPTITIPNPVCPGSTVTLSATTGISGLDSFICGWSINGTDIPNANTPTLTLSNVSDLNAGSYMVRIISTEFCNKYSSLSPIASLSLKTTPIINQVVSPTIESGSSNNINLSSSPNGAVFTWDVIAAPETTIAGAAPGTGNNISQILTNTGTEAATISYVVSAVLNGCKAQDLYIEQTVKPTITTDISTDLVSNRFIIAPNPVKDILTVSSNHNTLLVVEIIDTESGLTLAESKDTSGTVSIFLGHLVPKMYFCKITTAEQISVHKIIVNN